MGLEVRRTVFSNGVNLIEEEAAIDLAPKLGLKLVEKKITQPGGEVRQLPHA